MATIDRLDYLRLRLRELEEVAGEAREAGSFTAAVQALAKAVQIRSEIDELERLARALAIPSDPKEHRRELMVTIRQMRLEAHAAGSYVAAAKLLTLEEELLARADADAADAVDFSRRKLSDADVIAAIEELRRKRGAK
jgi:hypothetical protein